MTNATATVKLADGTAPPVKRGFPSLHCLYCSEEDSVSVNLGDVTTFRCAGCETEWSAEEARQKLARWTAVLVWCDLAPPVEG
jgi:hypothetical protein